MSALVAGVDQLPTCTKLPTCTSSQSAPIDKRDVASLAHLANALYYLKFKFTDPDAQERLKQAVVLMHLVATEADYEHGYGVYAQEEVCDA